MQLKSLKLKLLKYGVDVEAIRQYFAFFFLIPLFLIFLRQIASNDMKRWVEVMFYFTFLAQIFGFACVAALGMLEEPTPKPFRSRRIYFLGLSFGFTAFIVGVISLLSITMIFKYPKKDQIPPDYELLVPWGAALVAAGITAFWAASGRALKTLEEKTTILRQIRKDAQGSGDVRLKCEFLDTAIAYNLDRESEFRFFFSEWFNDLSKLDASQLHDLRTYGHFLAKLRDAVPIDNQGDLILPS